jgi:hypothetical protein
MWAIGNLAWQARVEPTIIGNSGFPSSSATRDGIQDEAFAGVITAAAAAARVKIGAGRRAPQARAGRGERANGGA